MPSDYHNRQTGDTHYILPIFSFEKVKFTLYPHCTGTVTDRELMVAICNLLLTSQSITLSSHS